MPNGKPETAVCYFIGVAHAHQIKVEYCASRLPRQTARFRSFKAVMASKRTASARDNGDSAEVSTRTSGLSSLKVERVNPLHFVQSVFVNFL
jgi:hypothetical protein